MLADDLLPRSMDIDSDLESNSAQQVRPIYYAKNYKWKKCVEFYFTSFGLQCSVPGPLETVTLGPPSVVVCSGSGCSCSSEYFVTRLINMNYSIGIFFHLVTSSICFPS